MVMILKDAINQYGSLYKVKQAMQKGELFKLSPGLYSKNETASDIEIVMASYKDAIFIMDNAFYFWGLTDVIPDQLHLATGRHMTRIKMAGAKQYFESVNYYGIGKTQMLYNGLSIRCYDRERMLLELIRHRNKMAFDYYKEIVQSYRQLKDSLDFAKLDDYIDAIQATCTNLQVEKSPLSSKLSILSVDFG